MGAISSSDKTLDVIKGGYHELLMGPEKEDVVLKLVAWINQHASGVSRL
jgi:alpha-beta hydrolase superfamily lysophospholipase